MTGRIVKRTELIDDQGSRWELWLTDWGAGRVTAQLNPPNDPEHELYGRDGPRFPLADVRAACACRPFISRSGDRPIMSASDMVKETDEQAGRR